MKHTAKTIDTALRAYYDTQALYLVSNIYAFNHAYGETDMLVVKSSNKYCYDIEIKVSRGDFSADFNKESKHSILGKGTYKKKNRVKPIEVLERPNRFYFAVPEGLVTAEEVPDYAGLLYVKPSGMIFKVKEAKLLHNRKLNIEKLLCRKFYFYWLNTMEALETVKIALKSCEKLRK